MELDVFWGNRYWVRSDEGEIVEDLPLDPGDERWIEYESLPGGSTLEYYQGDSLRQEFRKQILDSCLKSISPSEEDKIAIFTNGGTGAGKTSSVEYFLANRDEFDSFDPIRIDFDAIKKELPEYRYLVSKSLKCAAPYVHSESFRMASNLFDKSMNRGLDIIFDSTMVNFKINHQRMTSLKKRGYHIIIIATYANVENAIQRAELRFHKGGRHVPEEIIRSNFKRAPETLARLHHLSDLTVLFDNNDANRRLVLIGEPGSYQVESQSLYSNYLALFGNQCCLTKIQ